MFQDSFKKLPGGIVILAIMGVITVSGYLLISHLEEVGVDGWSWARLWLYGWVAYTISSFRIDKIIGPNDIGVRLLFGAPTDQISSGLPIVPPGLFTLRKFSILVQQWELPGEPQEIYRGEMKDPEEFKNLDGKVPPIRITFNTSINETEAQTLFGDDYTIKIAEGDEVSFNPKVPNDGLSDRRVTAEVVIIIRFRIQNGIEFIKAIGDLGEAKRQIEDAAISLVARTFSRISVAQAFQNLQWVSRLLFGDIEKRIGKTGSSASWGLDLETATVKLIQLHHDLNTAIGNASEASFVKQKTITDAEGEERKRALEGSGDGLAEQAILEHRTAGLKKMAEELGVNPVTVLGAETARAITNNPGNKTLIAGAGGFSELLGTVAAIGEAAKGADQDKE